MTLDNEPDENGVSSMRWVESAPDATERRERLIRRGLEIMRAEAKTPEEKQFIEWLLAEGWEQCFAASAWERPS